MIKILGVKILERLKNFVLHTCSIFFVRQAFWPIDRIIHSSIAVTQQSMELGVPDVLKKSFEFSSEDVKAERK